MPNVKYSTMTLCAAAAITTGLLAPAQALAQDSPDGIVYTGADPLSDPALSAVYGTGISRQPFLRRAARDQFEDFGRQTAEVASVTFDNWFNDVGTPLIVANLSR